MRSGHHAVATRFAACAALLAALLLLAACSSPPDTGGGPSNPPETGEGAIRLDGVEVREYEGERLDSVNDFRENSIKGVQRVDRETYRMTVKGRTSSSGRWTATRRRSPWSTCGAGRSCSRTA